MIIDEIEKFDEFVIYGAQVVAYGAYVAIKGLFNKVPLCFVVNSLDNNPADIEGIPVKEIRNISKNIPIVVGVTELIQKEVVPYLNKEGYKSVYLLSQREEYSLMSAYFRSVGKFPVIEKNIEDKESRHIDFVCYEVSNHRDKPLSMHPNLKSHEKAIQAGAALTDVRVADLTDFSGDNISAKNKQYCEMSATYWVWKNTSHEWKGIEHYRRHIILTPEMLTEDIDAILPLPYICYPNTMHQFRRFVNEEVKNALYKALKTIHPVEYDDYIKILEGKYQYTYNIVCAKKDVFDAYCKWFFEITEYMENMSDEVPDIANTRALSYVAEVLTNLYFMYNQERLVIRHVPREIYV